MSRAREGALYVLLAGVLWGTTGTAQALGPDTSDPLSVGALRILVGAAALVLIASARGQRRAMLALPRSALLVAAVGVAAYQASFFAAVKLAGVATGTLVAIGSSPLLIALVARERPTRAWLLATGLCVAGLGALGAAQGLDAGNVLGLALALVAGLSYALYAVACSRMARAGAPPDAMMGGVFGVGALLLAPAFLFVDAGWAATPRGAAMVLHLGLAAMALAYVLFGRGLQRIPVTAAGTLSLMEPLTATLLAVLVLGERLSALAWFGAALLLVGLASLALAAPAPPEADASALPPQRS